MKPLHRQNKKTHMKSKISHTAPDFVQTGQTHPMAENSEPKPKTKNNSASSPPAFIPYGHQLIEDDDIQAVIDVLQSDWLTTGPRVTEFESAFAECTDAKAAVAVSSGTAALHCAIHAAGIGPGDEVILPPMTFVATANAVVFQGGIPVFADIEPDTLLINPHEVETLITPRTKAIIAVDYAGHPCDYDALKSIADSHNLILIADACHTLGAEYKGEKVGTLADLTVFSFHPVKHITTGEGGMVVTNHTDLAEKMRRFRNHGIDTDHRQRALQGTWYYEMVDLGFNYRISDIQCALGLSQLKKSSTWLQKRRDIAQQYDITLSNIQGIQPLTVRENVLHAYHLYVIQLNDTTQRAECYQHMRNNGIGVNVHYLPVHRHPYYQTHFETARNARCPMAEAAYERVLSLPIHQGLNDAALERIIDTLKLIRY
jgi:perosamine synthetase